MIELWLSLMRELFLFAVASYGKTEIFFLKNGPLRQKPRITKPKGEDPHQWAQAQPKVQFLVMQWAAMLTEPVMGPEYVWEAETAEERDAGDEKLLKENAARLKEVEEQRERALRPGTEEFIYMEASKFCN